MWQVQGFKTRKSAEKFQKEHGGSICWAERTPSNALTAKGREYMMASGAVGLDRETYPYLVQRRI